MTKTNFHVFLLFAKGPLNDAVGMARGATFQEIRPRDPVARPVISFKERRGGLPQNDARIVVFFWTLCTGLKRVKNAADRCIMRRYVEVCNVFFCFVLLGLLA